jgi:hypothetical protein
MTISGFCLQRSRLRLVHEFCEASKSTPSKWPRPNIRVTRGHLAQPSGNLVDMSSSKAAIGIDVFPRQWRQRPEIGFGQSALPIGLCQHLLT